ncbi:MAG TPA: aspartate kinase, partial [Spirochaetia bacterium]|nr:aspartate kinase [Spirochaetia bacterium]
MKVMKFGGSSVQDAERIKGVCRIIIEENRKEPAVAVLSAMRGITDLLISTAKKAEQGDLTYKAELEEIIGRHTKVLAELIGNEGRAAAMKGLDLFFDELKSVLHGIELVRECSPRSLDLVMSFGERLNCFLAASFITSIGQPAEFVDARSMIVTDSRFGNAVVDMKESAKKIREVLDRVKGIPIVTGFIASTREGVTTTIGRNGSDYTATIIGNALDATVVEIWKDVDGVLTANPKYVKEAFVLPEITFQDAIEMSYFGAEVIHPYTTLPAIEKNIPIRIKNTFNPSAPGTLISANGKKTNRPITGIASIDNVALINIEGSGMIGTPGMASRVFVALAREGVNIIMISQASSEHSICLVMREGEVAHALRRLETDLKEDIELKRIQRFDLKKGLEIVAVIG